MVKNRIFYVGTPGVIEHQAKLLQSVLPVQTIAADAVREEAKTGDLFLFTNEHYPEYRAAIAHAQTLNCPTVYAPDGITEWRSTWESEYIEEALRPILCHKVAAIGRSQARIFESWGNWPKCEVVGLPRLDNLLGRQPRNREPEQPFRILVMTAKRPGFNSAQYQIARDSLRDLKQWFEQNPIVNGITIEPVWRIHTGIEQELGISNQLRDVTGQDIATALEATDAVITTPSTAMLEGMLQGIPVALIDYNNCPHLIPGAWRITAQPHIAQVIAELLQPPAAKMLYQTSILHDALECRSPAAPRMAALAEAMLRIAHDCLTRDLPLQFPPRILADEPPTEPAAESQLGLEQLQAELQAHQQQISQLSRDTDRKQETITALEQEVAIYRQKMENLHSHPLVKFVLHTREAARGLRSGRKPT